MDGGAGRVMFNPMYSMQHMSWDDREPLLAKRFRENGNDGGQISRSSMFQPMGLPGNPCAVTWQEPSVEHQVKGNNSSISSKQAFLRLPELIDTLAKDEKALRWDPTQSWFEVMDGPLFEEKFNALRCIRGKRREDAVDRPFARMHIHFVLARGDKWAGTGSAFRPKGETIFRSLGQDQAQSCTLTSDICPTTKEEYFQNPRPHGMKSEPFPETVTQEKRWKPADALSDTVMHEKFNPMIEVSCLQSHDRWDSNNAQVSGFACNLLLHPICI